MAFKHETDIYCILLTSAINTESLNTFYQKAVPLLKKADHLNLYIDSAGGQVVVALGLARFLTSLGKKVTTFNVGHCDSAAIVLFAAGHERIANAAGCQFAMHEVGIGMSGIQTLASLAKIRRQLERDTNRICAFLERQTGRASQFWQKDMTRSRKLTSAAALRCRLATAIAPVATPARTIAI